MSANVGNTDRIVRLLIAAVAVILAIVTGPAEALGIVLWIVAAVMAVTALVGFCPLYRIFGITTCPVKRS